MSLRTRVLIWVLAGMFTALQFILAFARYTTFHNRTFDLALYARQAWGLAHGELWDPIAGAHFLGTHVSLVLWPLGVLGSTYGTVYVLLFAQALAVGLATLPLAQIAARRFGDAGAAVIAVAWLAYPNLGHVATYEFHPGTLGVLPLAFALDAIDRKAGAALGLSVLGLLCCRADFALLGMLLGVTALLFSRANQPADDARALRRGGVFALALSASYLALSMFYLRRYWPAFGSLDLHFGKWGGSPLGVFRALLSDPLLVLAHFTEPARLSYPLKVLWPVAFLPLLAPRYLLITLPFFAINLISEFPTTTEMYSHYLTPAVPAFIVGGVAGLQVLQQRLQLSHPSLQVAPIGLLFMMLCTLSSSYALGGLPWSCDFDEAAFEPDARSREAANVLAHIPAQVSVQAPDLLLPHLAERKLLFRAPPPDRNADYVVLDVSHRVRYAHTETLLRTTEEPMVRRWLGRRDYGLLHAESSLYLLGRGADPRGGISQRYFLDFPGRRQAVPLSRCLWLLSAWLNPTGLELELFAQAPCPNDLALRLGPEARPSRVDLLFDGLLSPAQLRDEYLMSWHPLDAAERDAILKHGLRIGALRSSGAPPDPDDPVTVDVALIH